MIASYYQILRKFFFEHYLSELLEPPLLNPHRFFTSATPPQLFPCNIAPQNTPIYIYNTAMFEEEESC